MRISAKADYAMRAMLELAAAEDPPVKCEDIADSQNIPVKFLEKILSELHRAGLVASHRGTDGGYELARPPEEIQLAEVLRVIEGPLAVVRDVRPEELDYDGSAEGLREAWVALREHAQRPREDHRGQRRAAEAAAEGRGDRHRR